MIGLGIQALGLLTNGLRIGFWHSDVVELLEVVRVLGQSYRLASMGDSSCMVFGRFMFCFGRTVLAATLCKLVW